MESRPAPWNARGLLLLHELRLRGTLAAVAEALRFSPSTVSYQLGQLQKEVGAPLFTGDGRGVRLTAQGELVAAHAASMIAAQEEVQAALDAEAEAIAPVRIAAVQTASRTLLPRMLTVLTETAPRMRVDITVVPPEKGLFEVAAGSLDLAMAEQYPGHTRALPRGMDRELIGTDPLRLASAAGSSIRSLADAREAAWVMEPPGTAARAWAEQQCRAVGFEPDVRFESTDLHAHVRLIESGHAVGIVPGLAIDGDDLALQLTPLPGAAHREIFTSVRASSRGRRGIRAVREALQAAWSAA